jgi:hypothetical protein
VRICGADSAEGSCGALFTQTVVGSLQLEHAAYAKQHSLTWLLKALPPSPLALETRFAYAARLCLRGTQIIEEIYDRRYAEDVQELEARCAAADALRLTRCAFCFFAFVHLSCFPPVLKRAAQTAQVHMRDGGPGGGAGGAAQPSGCGVRAGVGERALGRAAAG